MILLYEFPTDHFGYVAASFTSLDKICQRRKFVSAMAHMSVDCSGDGTPIPNSEIERRVQNDIVERPPLQKHSMYLFCKLENFDKSSGLWRELCKPVEDFRHIVHSIEGLTTYETDYFKFPDDTDIVKNIKYVNVHNGEEIGWYNLRTNILWISDIGHYGETIVERVTGVLNGIDSYIRFGEIPVLSNLTIGADPEFEIFTSKISSPDEAHGKDIPANSLFTGGGPKTKAEVGHNGNPETGELRPRYANNPLRLARNIKRSVKRLVRNDVMNNLTAYVGGGWSKQLGGHIHFNLRSCPDKLKDSLYDLIGVWLRKGMDRSKRQSSSAYMSRDGHEVVRPADTHAGFEWRLLPSFIINQEISEAVLCTTWCVVKAFYAGVLPTTREEMPAEEVITVLKGLPLYDTYQKQIVDFINTFVTRLYGCEGKDLKEEWKISPNIGESNVIISSPIVWVNSQFRPVNVDLARPIRLHVDVNNETEGLVAWGKKANMGKADKIMQEFAESHLCDYEYKERDTGDFNLMLRLPRAWINIRNTALAFDIMKNLLQKVIIAISETT